MIRKGFYFLLIYLVALISCDELKISENDDLIVEFGTNCGRCAGTERIKIESSVLKYEKIIPCGQEKSTINKERNFSEMEWKELRNSYNYQLYLTLKYNECHTCYDGCDEVLSISLNDTIHELKYLPGKKITEIESFQNKLKDLMEEMRTK